MARQDFIRIRISVRRDDPRHTPLIEYLNSIDPKSRPGPHILYLLELGLQALEAETASQTPHSPLPSATPLRGKRGRPRLAAPIAPIRQPRAKVASGPDILPTPSAAAPVAPPAPQPQPQPQPQPTSRPEFPQPSNPPTAQPPSPLPSPEGSISAASAPAVAVDPVLTDLSQLFNFQGDG